MSISAPIDSTIQSQCLVGRDAKVQHVRRVLEAALDHRGQVLLISGEAGIGKTRLISEAFSPRGRELGEAVRIVTGHCYEQDRALPYAPLIDLLRASDLIDLQYLSGLSPLARLLPELGEAPPLGEPEQDKRKLFETLAQSLLQRSERLSLLILEDLHWADDATLDFLQFFARRIPSQPIALVLTYRSDEMGDSLHHFLAQLDRARAVTEINLQPLEKDDTRAMIHAIFADTSVRAEFADAIHTLTDGNPFFIEETLKSLVASGDIYKTHSGWARKPLRKLAVPRSVQDAVQQRTRTLTDDQRQVLIVAAVLGQRFDFDLLCDVLRSDELVLLEHLKTLIAAHLIIEDGDGEQFAFRHALTRQAVLTQHLARERRPIHRAVAQAIEQRYTHNLDLCAAELAFHYFEAGEWQLAADHARRAADRAESLHAARAATENINLAIEALTRAEQVLSPMLLNQRGKLRESLGEFDAANDDLERARALAHNAGDLRSEWKCLFDLGYLWNGRDHVKAGAYLERALEAARALKDDAALAHSLYRLGNWHNNMDAQQLAQRYQEEALHVFERLDDKPGLARALDLISLSTLLSGEARASDRYRARAIALFRELNDLNNLALCLMTYAARGASYLTDCAVVDDVSLDACRRDADEALQLSRQLESKSVEAGANIYVSFVLGARGNYAEAITRAGAGSEVAREIGHSGRLCMAQLVLGAIYTDLLMHERARTHLEEGLRIARGVRATQFVATAIGFVAPACVADGRLEEAATLLDEMYTALGDALTTNIRRLLQTTRAEWLLARHQPAEALAMLDEIIAATPNALPARADVVPRLWLRRGEALHALGRWTEAQATLRAALDRAYALGVHSLVWRIHLALGQTYRAMRKAEAATTEFDAARAAISDVAVNVPAADELRATFLQRALALLPAGRLTPARQAKREAGGLTARERGIAVFIAQGKSNRDIAVMLTLGQRTVEWHVTNILNKLGVDTRAQVAAWVVEHGLL